MRAPAEQRALRVRREDLTNDPRPGAPNKLAHIVYKTPRPQEMIDWYTEVLDAVLVFANKRIAFLTYDDEHHRIALIKVPWLLRIPGAIWKVYRKFWGFDHVAFAYQRLDQLSGEEFERNPIGIEFDPKVLERLLAAGVPATALIRRGSAPPDGQPARAGRRTLRWKTL